MYVWHVFGTCGLHVCTYGMCFGTGGLQQAQVETDMSLASLRFTESSSMDGMALGQVVELLDRNLTELSPINGGKTRVRHSTPEGAPQRDGGSAPQGDGGLELVGKGVKTHVKAGARTTQHFGAVVRTRASASARTGKVRNYNRK